MLVRALIPISLSACLLVFGPSAKGDLELKPPAVPEVELAVPEVEPAPVEVSEAPAQTPDLPTHALLASRLEALDRGLPHRVLH